MSGVEQLSVYKSDSIPQNYHYGCNPRTLDIHIKANHPWSVYYMRKGKYSKGAHGYEPQLKDMHAIFYAEGPAFKRNVVVSSFRNTEIYNLLCYLLSAEAKPNNRNIKHIRDLLYAPK